MKTIVDTSAWIEFFNAGDSPTAEKVAALVTDDDALITGLVRCEILVGLRTEASFKKTREILDEFTALDDATDEARDTAVAIYRTCRKRGRTIRSLVDCLIAAAAMLNDLPVLARDRDFRTIARFFPLGLSE